MKTSKKRNVQKQEKERHKKVEIRKIERRQRQKQIKEKKKESCADCHDESITFLQGNISQYTRKLYEMKSSLSEGYKIKRGFIVI